MTAYGNSKDQAQGMSLPKSYTTNQHILFFFLLATELSVKNPSQSIIG